MNRDGCGSEGNINENKSKAVLSASRSRHLKLFSDAGVYASSQEAASLLEKSLFKAISVAAERCRPCNTSSAGLFCGHMAAVAPPEPFLVYSSLNKARNSIAGF